MIIGAIGSDDRRKGIHELPGLASELLEPGLVRHEAGRSKPWPEPKSEE